MYKLPPSSTLSLTGLVTALICKNFNVSIILLVLFIISLLIVELGGQNK